MYTNYILKRRYMKMQDDKKICPLSIMSGKVCVCLKEQCMIFSMDSCSIKKIAWLLDDIKEIMNQ